MDKLSKGSDVSYKYHSTQINLYDCCSEKDFNFFYLQKKVPNSMVYREYPQVAQGPFEMMQDDPREEYGYEHTPHITVLYGLKNDEDYFKIRDNLSKIDPFEFKIGNIASFRGDKNEYDVLIVEIVSPGLSKIHEDLKKKYDNDYKYPEYKPHMTLAYVKKGACKEIEGKSLWTGQGYTCPKIQFSHKDKYFLEIPLKV